MDSSLASSSCLLKHGWLQAVWYYVQQPLASLGLLAGLAGQASREGLRGAPLLDLLQTKAASVAGNPAARYGAHPVLSCSLSAMHETEIKVDYSALAAPPAAFQTSIFNTISKSSV